MNTSHRRKFTDDEKRRIVEEALVRGINVLLQENRLSYSVFSRWRKKFEVGKEVQAKRNQRRIVQHLNEVVIENGKLKKIIADLLLELQAKTDRLNILSQQNNIG